MKNRVVYQNGEFVPESEARISIYDSALMFGDMVFEMTRSFNKKQFMLREHLVRLYEGIKCLRIPEPMPIEQLEQVCHEVVKQNDPLFSSDDEHRLMINVSRGPLAIYSEIFGGKIEPTVTVADFPLKWTVASMAKLFDTGINAIVPQQRSIPGHLLDPKIKNRSRIFYQLANIEVSQAKGDNNWALLTDPDGYVTEGTGCNFFMVKDGTLFTPEPRNILRGISRAFTLQIANSLGIPTQERNLEIFDVMTADEAFVTGTPFSILPVTSINGVKIGGGQRGSMTNRLLNTWSERVGLDIERQIRTYSEQCKNLSTGPSPYQFKPK